MAKHIQNIPQAIQDRLNRTPAERKAQLEAKRQTRLAAMTPQQRQEAQQRIDRINAVPVQKRPAFIQASRLAMVARTLRARTEAGMKFEDVFDSLDTNEAEAVNWLADQVVAVRNK